MKKVLLIFFLFFSLSAEPCRDTLRINFISGPNDFATRFLKELYYMALDSLNMCGVFHNYPPKRAALMLNEGTLDVEGARAYEFQMGLKEIIRVPVVTMRTRIVAYAADSSIYLEEGSWEALAKSEYRVEYLRGTKAIEVYLPKYVDSKKTYVVNNISSGMNRLLEGRSDIFISASPLTRGWFLRYPDRAKRIREVANIQVIDVYAYLSPHRKDLLDEFTRILQNMVDRNIVDSVYNEELIKWSNEFSDTTIKIDELNIKDLQGVLWIQN